MIIETSRFGEVEITDDDIICGKIIGLGNVDEWYLIDYPSTRPFIWLQAIYHPRIAFPILSCDDMNFNALKVLGIKCHKEAKAYFFVTISQDTFYSYVHLRNIILIDFTRRYMIHIRLNIDDKFPEELNFFGVIEEASVEENPCNIYDSLLYSHLN